MLTSQRVEFGELKAGDTFRFDPPQSPEEYADEYMKIAGNTADQLNSKGDVVATIDVRQPATVKVLTVG